MTGRIHSQCEIVLYETHLLLQLVDHPRIGTNIVVY